MKKLWENKLLGKTKFYIKRLFIRGSYLMLSIGLVLTSIGIGYFLMAGMTDSHDTRLLEAQLRQIKESPEYARANTPDFLRHEDYIDTVIVNPQPVEIELKRRAEAKNKPVKKKQTKAVKITVDKAKMEEHPSVPDTPVKLLTPEKFVGTAKKDSLYKPLIKINRIK